MKTHVWLAVFSWFLIGALVFYGYVHRDAIALFSPHGTIALAERNVMIITALLSAIVVVPVYILLFAFAFFYRADHPRAHRHYFPNWDHHSLAAETIWWLVPTVIIIFLSILSWQTSHALDP